LASGDLSAQPLSRNRWAGSRWLVPAPHANDETIGAGALIAMAGRQGRPAGVAFVTDGSGSHPHVDDRSRATLVALRRRKEERALRGRKGSQGQHEEANRRSARAPAAWAKIDTHQRTGGGSATGRPKPIFIFRAQMREIVIRMIG
jgi:hypothetical protein